MNDLYEAFCLVDPVFYDAPGSVHRGDGLLVRLGRELPPGWTVEPGEVWTSVHPDGVELPEQGWKIHVAACLDNTRRVLATVWDHCIGERLHFKFIDSPATFIAQNAKYADRSGSGKFVTIYPVDEAALERSLRRLGRALRGEHGPYILSDLRWEGGPLFVRYGGFLLQHCRTAEGRVVPAIRDPHGALVPDDRAPALRIPPWVELPAVLTPAWAAHEAEPAEPFPYTVTGALHFSNGGGVYSAVDARGAEVVLKERDRTPDSTPTAWTPWPASSASTATCSASPASTACRPSSSCARTGSTASSSRSSSRAPRSTRRWCSATR